jgi:phosphoglycerol transferase MdoB-like AlkP superfamily enzyme
VPFLAEILTVSNHHPFIDLDTKFKQDDLHPDLPRNFEDTYNRYQHLIYYTDKALGQFWDRFRQSRFYNNTVVVISGDHGIWLFPDEYMKAANDKSTFQYEAYLRLPLTIYFPGKTFSGETNTVMSQVDIAELLMHYLGINAPRAFQTKLDKLRVENLLQQDNTEDEFDQLVITFTTETGP